MMSKLTVFQVVVVVRGKEGKGDNEDIPDRLATELPVLVLATDAQQAALMVAMDQNLPADERQRVEVLARPF